MTLSTEVTDKNGRVHTVTVTQGVGVGVPTDESEDAFFDRYEQAIAKVAGIGG